MKKEKLARILVIVLVVAAAAIPLAGYFLVPILGAKTIDLHARMAENGGWSMDAIQAEVGQPLHLRLTSDDVMHSFAIGKSDRAPIDIVPGEVVETTPEFRQARHLHFLLHPLVWGQPLAHARHD